MSNNSSRFLFSMIYLLCCFSITEAEEPSATGCERGARPMRVEIRHIENKGVGYNTGYTTLETFLAPSPDMWSILPFVDLRGHVFDDGKLAANAGIGIRALAGCRVYGANAYYDYRNTKRQHYNQVALGFETMGVRWDFRLNGYLPVGDKRSRPYDKHSTTNVSFDSFRGNNAFVKQTTTQNSKIQYAMKGLDAEVAFHFLKNKNFDLYAAAGPYYYNYRNKQAIGGRVRVAAQIYEYLSLEAINSYDSRFHEIVQGQIGINIPFGPRQTPSKNKRLKNCTDACLLSQRLVQDVQRQEIIVVDRFRKKEVSDITSVAIDPRTGNPYFFLFVDNTSHSAGTYESPFPTLVDAQNISQPGDIIYVFPGDLTTTGLNAGITLKDNQKLWGSVVSHTLDTTLGAVEVPSSTPSQIYSDAQPTINLAMSPVITNLGAGDVVRVANNNEISGLYIQNLSGSGIAASSVNGLTVTHCIIQGPIFTTAVSPPTDYGINLSNVTGTVLIDSNFIYQGIMGINIAATGIQNATYIVSNNDAPAGAFTNSASYGNFLVTSYTNCSNLTTNISGNSFTTAQSAINMIFNNLTSGLQACPVVINNNDMNADGNFVTGIIVCTLNHYANVDLTITNNEIDTPYTNAITITQNDIAAMDNHSQLNVLIENNTCDSWLTNLSVSLQGTAQFTGSIANNDFLFDDISGIIITATEASTIPNLSITGNQVSGDLVSYTTGSDAISITTGTNGGTDTSTARLTFSSNNIQAGSAGIALTTYADTMITASVTNNTSTHSQISGLNFQTNNSSTGTWTVDQNTFVASGLGYQNPPIAAALITASGGSTTNLSFNNNIAAPIYPDPTSLVGTYLFTNTGSTFNLTSYNGNTGVRTGP